MINTLQKFHAAFAHDHHTVRQGNDLLEHPALIGIGIAQDRVQRRDDRHAQFAQECQDITARLSSEDAVFMLQRHHVHVVDVQEIGGAAIGFNILLGQFEADPRRVLVACFGIIDRQRDAGGAFVFIGDGLAEIGGKCGNAALTRQVIADKGNSLND